MLEFLSVLWASAGTGIIAGAMVVLWDVSRILVQSRWIVKKLDQKRESCPHCQELTTTIDAIAKKVGVNHDSGHSRSD